MTSLRFHAGALALVLAGGLGTLGVRALAPPEAVTVDDALRRFRETPPAASDAPGLATPTPSATASAGSARTAPTAGPSARPGTPGTPGATPTATASRLATGGTRAIAPLPEGVYVYATTGYERGSAGPAAQRHDYPSETTTTARRSGCNVSLHWEPVRDRWDKVTLCAEGGTTRIREYDTQHSFFGVTERHTYSCSGDSWLRPPSTRAGFAWTFDCVSPDARTHTEARVVGIERVSAGDGTVEALHIRFDTTMTGRTEGTNPSDYWLALHEPFMVRKTGRVDAQVRTDAGTLTYHEEYDTRLTSRRPRT